MLIQFFSKKKKRKERKREEKEKVGDFFMKH